MKQADEARSLQRLVSQRSWLAYLVGGWNASAGVSCGRMEEASASDEVFARAILSAHRADVEKPLKAEITDLQAEVFRLRRELANSEAERRAHKGDTNE